MFASCHAEPLYLWFDSVIYSVDTEIKFSKIQAREGESVLASHYIIPVSNLKKKL